MKMIIIASILTLAISAGVAYGHGNGWNRGGGCGKSAMGSNMMQKSQGMMANGGAGCLSCPGPGGGIRSMGDEQRKDFLDSTAELRKTMHIKRFELREATRNTETSPAELAQLEKEIIDLRVKIQEKVKAAQQTTN